MHRHMREASELVGRKRGCGGQRRQVNGRFEACGALNFEPMDGLDG